MLELRLQLGLRLRLTGCFIALKPLKLSTCLKDNPPFSTPLPSWIVNGWMVAEDRPLRVLGVGVAAECEEPKPRKIKAKPPKAVASQ